MEIRKDMVIADLLEHEKAEVIAKILMDAGMHCLGCPSAQMETVEEACKVHGINVDEVINDINKALVK